MFTMRTTLASLFAALPGAAMAHASEIGFVLLLPTRLYIQAGCAAVALSVLIVGLMPGGWLRRLFAPVHWPGLPDMPRLVQVTRLLSTAALFGLILHGWFGAHDPLENLLPLMVWTVFWVAFVTVQALVGDLWSWLNPWTGLYRMIGPRALMKLPNWVGHWPAVAGLVLFSIFALADPAPDDPSRLAVVVGVYWLVTFVGMCLFGGEVWLSRAEAFTVLLRQFAALAAVAWARPAGIGLPGWRALEDPPTRFSLAVFILAILGVGSFDGLNETFWWLSNIGVNPLEFPGRSAIIGRTVTGLIFAVILLVAVFAVCIWLGLKLAGPEPDVTFHRAFCTLAASVLPIALGYHVAHFLVAYLINIQYFAVGISDPLGTGADLLNLGEHYVSTGFLKTRDSVHVIWLVQAGAIVLAHILAVFMAHHGAATMYGDRWRTMLSQLPLALFMVAYTLFGLWLLATARGA